MFDACGNYPMPPAPRIKHECAVFSGEACDAVRADDPACQPVADFDGLEARRDPEPVGYEPVMADFFDLLELFAGPFAKGSELALEHSAPLGLRSEVANGGRALFRDQRAMLIGMDRIATRKQGRARKTCVREFIAVKASLLEQTVAGADAGAIEPPFLTAEDQMRAGDRPTQAGWTPCAKSIHTVKDCGATIPPNRD